MTFAPETDIPDLAGKVIIVTGGSSGLGKETVHQLAKHNPTRIFVAARTAARGNAAINEVVAAVPAMRDKLTYLEMDLSSFASLQKAADVVNSTVDRLDILINNAGLMAQPEGLTEDGYEVQFGANYMGPALLTELLLPLLQRTAREPDADVRVVNLSSELFKQAPTAGLLLDQVKTPLSEISSVSRYGHSKLADYYHTHNLAGRYPMIKFVAVHPGVVNTGLFDDLRKRRPWLGAVLALIGAVFLTDVHKGARTQLWAATAPTQRVESGGFYAPSLKQYDHALLRRKDLAQSLESWTHKEFRDKGVAA